MEPTSSLSAKALQWIRRYPLLLILLGHCLFSLGIWKVQVGFGEDTTPLTLALANVSHHTLSPNIYVDLFTGILAVVTPDPLTACVVMRFLVSGFTAISLYLVLSRFSGRLSIEAILFACFVWIASRLNAPTVVYTNISGFAFAIMLVGIYFLFSPRRILGFAGFVFFSALAVSLRPEWMAPFLLIVLFLVAEFLVRWWKNCAPQNRAKGALLGGAAILLAAGVTFGAWPRLSGGMGRADGYLLMGLGQCYGNFLKAEHPEQAFDPMTEYQWVLDQTFGKPATFAEAMRNNPHEAMRYFRWNTATNLRKIPEELLSTRGGKTASLISRPHSVLLYGILAGGGICAVVLAGRRKRTSPGAPEAATDSPDSGYELTRKIVILVLLCSASSVAIVMLVGTPRYWISIVPLLYLAIAWCGDALLKTLRFPAFAVLMTLAALASFCRPNFLDTQGNNYEVRAMRAVAPQVRKHPVIGALWAEPLVIYGFRGEAEGVSAWDGIKSEEVAKGRFDVLSLDRGFRASKTWVEQQAFFEAFEADPARYGFKKLEGVDIGPRTVYYRPPVATP